MTTRRTVVSSLAVAGLGLGAGCLDLAFGEDLEFEADPAEVDPEIAAEAGYEHHDTRELPYEETVEVGESERDIEATNWAASYGKDVPVVEGTDVAAFSVVSTPDPTVAGQQVNPIANYEHDELLEEFGDELTEESDLEDLTLDRQESVTMLGESTTLSVFEATAEVDGETVDALIHVADVAHEGDIVLAAGAHPTLLDEAENVRSMIGGVEHPV